MNHSFSFSVTDRPNLCLPSKEAYPAGKVTIKNDKMKDVKKLQSYIPVEFEDFYAEIYVVNNQLKLVEVENDGCVVVTPIAYLRLKSYIKR